MLDKLLGLLTSGPGQAVAILLLPLLLSVLNPEKAYKVWRLPVIAFCVAMSLFFNNKLGKLVANMIEKYITKSIVYLVFFTLLDGIEAFRKDNKITLKAQITKSKTSLKELIIK